jgi:penicillin-binding protein 2
MITGVNNEKEKEIYQDRKRRFLIFFIIIVIFCGVFLRQLVDLQIVNGMEYLDTSTKRNVTNGVIYANRGNIYDRYGVPIAGNRMGYCVQYVDTKLSDKEKNATIARLVDLFSKNGDRYISNMRTIFSYKEMDFLINREGFVNRIAIRDEDKAVLLEAEPREVFDYMREKTFNIDAQYTDEEAYHIMELRYEILNNINYATISDPLLIAEDVSIETMVALEERNEEFSGFTTYSKPFREYYDAYLVAHVLGYMGNIDKNYEKWSKAYPELGYKPNDKVGVSGIELSEEHSLRGLNGIARKEVDTEGRLTSYEVEESPIPGQDIYLTIDLNLQKASYEAIERNIEIIREKEHKKSFHDANAGAVVAMNVKTGEILAMVSYPSYDPVAFLEGNNAQINYILNHPDKIIMNRATSGNYAPGSTYKPIIAIAGLESGVITATQKIDCPYTKTIGGLVWRNPEGNQGRINLERALETSSNMYFFQVGFTTGIDNIVKWAKNFGFGKKTGIEIGESIGALASREYKLEYIKEGWVPADTCNASIGQLYNAFTPIQLVNYVSTIGNGGKIYRPHLVRKRVDASGEVYLTEIEYQQSSAKESTIKAVQKGMVAVANSQDGTAVDIFKDFRSIIGEVAGKTGTAETGLEATSSSNALFVCYAPADDPEIAVAVVVEKGVSGAWSAPIARDVLMAYFNIQEQSN